MKLKNKILVFLFFASLFLCIGQNTEPEIKNLKFKHYSLEDGLSQSSVLSIVQDKNGFIWFGTRDGLNKYDGYTFKTYSHLYNDSTSISNNYIKTLFVDPQGHLWVGTQDGLNKFLEDQDCFKRYLYKSNEQKNANTEIWDIVSYDENNLWVGTNNGLILLNTTTEEINFENEFELNNPVRSLLKSNDDKFWIKTTKTIGSYDQKTKKYINYTLERNDLDDLNLSIISCLFEDSQKNIWLGYRNGLAIFNKEEKIFKPFKLKNNIDITDNVRSIHEDFLGNIWVGTYYGIYIINAKKTIIKHFIHEESNKNSLSQNSVYKIYQDTKGDIWIGTYAGGINYFDRSYDSFRLFSSGNNNTINYKVVSSIVEDDDKLWIGTEGGGLNLYNGKTGNFIYYKHNPDNRNSLSSDNVKAVIKDIEGNLWIGTHEGGLNLYNPNKPQEFIKFLNDPEDTLTISNNRVIALYEDLKQDNIWLGTSGGGVNIINKNTKLITRFNEIKSLAGEFVYTITKSEEEDYIFIGGNLGLCKVNVYTKEIETIPYEIKNNNDPTKNATLCVFEDNSQNLWIGTEGSGLYYYETLTETSTKFGINNGLPNEVVYAILPDEDNNLWLSTNYGLSKLNLKTKQFKNFDVTDGLQGNEFNYNSYLKSKNGDLYFGGANGLTIFNPNDIVENAFVPPVLITDIFVNNLPYLPKSKGYMKLNYTHNVFSFNFTALSFSKSKKNQYAYKLEGFDDDWNYVGTRRTTTYTNIDPGTYTFKVKAANSDGLWNEKGDEIIVKIKPAPWNTLFANILYLLGFITAGTLFRKYYLIRRKERKELQREREEKERIEEVNALKLKLFTNISHDFRTPLTLIIGPLQKMINDNTLVNPFIRKQHQIMHSNAMVLLHLINQFLDFRKNESGQLKLQASKSNIVSFLSDIKMSFDELALDKEINFQVKSSNTIINVWFDQLKLKKIIYNLLSNAFKNTSKGGDISINISKEKRDFKDNNNVSNYVKIEITDTGKGIPKEHMQNIFELYFQLKPDRNENLGTGIGLSLVKALVTMHKGYIEASSEEDKGSTFTVFLPLKKAHLNKNEIIDETPSSDYETDLHIPYQYIEEDLIENDIIEEFDKSLSTILIVEDNKDVRRFLRNLFHDKYNILEAKNGEMAFEIANDKLINLILSDVMMPIMNGIELCKAIKTDINTSHIPVVLLTAKTSEEYRENGFLTGADAYITKPFNSELLVTRIDNIIQSRKNLIKKFKTEAIIEPKAIAATSTDELFLENAFKIVMQNISNPEFSVNTLANELNMSQSALYRKIKLITGQSISKFVRTIKIKYAGQLIIAKKEMNISEIAYEVGFSDLKHFRNLFKNVFGELPSQYRNNFNEGKENNVHK